MVLLFFLICYTILVSASRVSDGLSILQFGAIPVVNTYDAAARNSEAIMKAFAAANEADSDRTVVVPKLPNDEAFYIIPVDLENMRDITFKVDGTLRVNDWIEKWDSENYPSGIVMFTEANNVRITGGGVIDGQGLKWWQLGMSGKADFRSDLVHIKQSQNVEVDSITLLNSPKFHLHLNDVAHATVHGITIFADSNVTRKNGHEGAVYPLNTDGIDLAAFNVTVYGNKITNYDDAIVAKPCKGSNKYCTCSGNMLIFDNEINFSVGLTIGSVPPNENVNCVRNVTFRDNTMWRPLKALYLKSNPGDSGTGIIESIHYENIYIEQTVWWVIWMGPQQQNQPGDSDTPTGCNFLFPFIPICPTNPLVTFNDISFVNITAVDTLPLFEGPGVMLCDRENPCTDVYMEDVKISMFEGDFDDIKDQLPLNVPGRVFPTRYRSDDFDFQYLTDNVYGLDDVQVDPMPCFNDHNCFWDGNAKHLVDFPTS